MEMNMVKERRNTIGERIKHKRLDAGLKQTDLADKLGISPATVSNWENDKSTPKSYDLYKLETIIGRVYRTQNQSRKKSSSSGQAEFPNKNQTPAEAFSDESPYSIWLRTTRLNKKLTVPELAIKASVTPATIYAIESGKISNPQERTQEKLADALGEPETDVTDETKKEAEVKGMGELVGFNPYEDNELPTCSGIYVLYDISERPIYVGQGGNIRARIKDHEQKFWFKAPIVTTGAYIKITDEVLRQQVETLLIKFLKSNAVLNKQNVDR